MWEEGEELRDASQPCPLVSSTGIQTGQTWGWEWGRHLKSRDLPFRSKGLHGASLPSVPWECVCLWPPPPRTHPFLLLPLLSLFRSPWDFKLLLAVEFAPRQVAIPQW